LYKNITLSADPKLIEASRARAKREKTTLNELFRAWLARYANPQNAESAYNELMENLSYAEAGRKFSREEMNER
jgi:hypothetical protein